MNEALLAILASLVAALIWVVKATSARTDRALQQRDRDVDRVIEQMTAAVQAFQKFEMATVKFQHRIVERLDKADDVHRTMLEQMREISQKLPAAPRGK